MKIARYSNGAAPKYGIVDGPELVVLKGHPLVNGYDTTGERIALKDVKLLAPTIPSKVVCIGKNFADHAAEIGEETTAEPLIFFKPSSAIIGHGESIVIPPQSKQVELEAELTIVIGKIAKNVSEQEALDYVFGYTIANDVTARDLQFVDGQWARSKAFDTFCPLGPWIETEFYPDGQVIESRINGEVRQNVSIAQMTHNIPLIVSYVSKNMTLLPGDIILTGSPAGISRIVSGDVIECEVEGIGILANSVSEASAH
jgi:2-keto-4-pentenoate hydratase/2-oxohepta-3-ene-1,7-dioic acid hydratase in catechol pathway